MSDFITLSCPTCGGKLQVTPNTSSLICQNCGNEHLVRRDAGSVLLEAFAKCPKCNRNDKVEKVTAIVSAQTQKLRGTTIQTSDYRDQDGRWHTTTSSIPFTGTQATVLAQRLSQPKKPEPNYGRSWSWVFYVGAVLMATGGCLPSILIAQFPAAVLPALMNAGGADTFISGVLYLILCVVCFVLLYLLTGIGPAVLLLIIGISRAKSYQATLPKKKALHEEKIKRWGKAIEKWQRLYYCSRDDGVFIPGENTLIPSESIPNYLNND